MSDMLELLRVILPYLERYKMDFFLVVCLMLLLIATTFYVIAWIIDQSASRNFFRSLRDIINFSKKRFEKANTSPYDTSVANSKLFLIIEFMYYYLIFVILFIYSLGVLTIGLIGKSQVWWGNIAAMFFGALIMIVARFTKVSADKAYYKFKNGKDWNEEI